MAKKFDIHEWKAKQRLAEEPEFTPDLEDDDLKRSKIQQMMAKEKGNATPVDGGMNQDDYDKVVDLLERYSLGEFLDAAVEFYQTGGEDESAELANKFAADFRKFLDGRDGGEEDELDEQNVTGTGTSFNAGDGEGYSTPNAFAKKGKWKGKKAVYEADEDDDIDWSLASDNEIMALGGDVYYGSEGGDSPEDGERMLIAPEDGWPQGRDLDGDGDIDIDDIDFTDPEANIEPERIDAPKDVEYIMNLIFQKINNRQEYGAFIRSALEMDVPQKTTAFQQHFKDMPSFKNLLIRFFGDEEDDTFTFNVEKQDESGLKKKITKGASKQKAFKAMDYRSRTTGGGQDIDKTIDKISGKYSSEKEKSKRKRKKEFDKWYKKSQEKS